MELHSTLGCFMVCDVIALLLLYFNYDKLCDVPLKSWLLVGVVLSVPSSFGSHAVTKKYGYKAGLLAELVLLIASLFWMAVGTVEVSISTTCQSTCPVIWWSVFTCITLYWCTVVGFIISAVVIILVKMYQSGGRIPVV